MDIFKCNYLTHENEEIIGFCLNQNCEKATQYCYECLTTLHFDHQNNCIRFAKLNQFMNEFITIYNQQHKQFKEISSKVQNCFEQIQKLIEQDFEKLRNMTEQLQSKNYLTFKSQINIIKRFYSKEKQNSTQKTIQQSNTIMDTINNLLIDLTTGGDQINQSKQKDTKIQEINKGSEKKKEQNIKESERLYKEGIMNLYLMRINSKEAIEYFDESIAINPEYDSAWYNKGLALNNWNKYQEAIECFDKCIAINSQNDSAWNNKGLTLRDQNKYQEAMECYDKCFDINPKNDQALSNKGCALHYLKQYRDALSFYDKALSIQVDPLTLKLKADCLVELGNKSEAKKIYQAALEKGYQNKDEIQKKLQKL